MEYFDFVKTQLLALEKLSDQITVGTAVFVLLVNIEVLAATLDTSS